MSTDCKEGKKIDGKNVQRYVDKHVDKTQINVDKWKSDQELNP
ncbi:hypothetical protein ACFL1A_01555 [Patescibacteria group bacterium]